MRRLVRILVLAALATPSGALAAERWVLQVFGGAPFNFNLPLAIHQSGHPDLKATGNYKSRPFEVPYYYAWRVGAWNGNRAWDERGLIFRAGLGVVITHPETTVRGLTDPQDGGLFDGYHLSGPTAQGAVEKRFHVFRWLVVSLEGKITATYAWIPVEGGHADVPDVAVHGLFGLGVEL